MKKSLVTRLKSSLKRFGNQEEGSIAPMIGLSMLAFCIAIGAAVDYGRVTNAQARLSAALDAAVIQVANQKTGTLADLEVIAKNTMEKNYGTDDYDKVTNFKLEGDVGSKLKASATVTVKTWFMAIGGIKTIDIPLAAEATAAGGVNVEVALVLDNTGSMAWIPGADYTEPSGPDEISRLTALKNAANSFVDKVVLDDQSKYFSKIAIAPYAANVNPGGTLLPASRVPLTNATCNVTYNKTTKKYTFPSPLCNKLSAGGTTYTAKACVTEREGADFNTDADMVTSRASPEYSETCNAAPVKLLTSNKANLHTLINSMGANNGTAGHIGIQWGYQLLSPNSTLSDYLTGTEKTEGKPKAYPLPDDTVALKKVMVIMTDGDFNHDNCKGFDNGDYCTNAAGNSLTQAAAICNNAKAGNKIELYFINLTTKTPSASVKTMMDACSTDAAHQILASDAVALQAAFDKIAASINTMRLTM